MAKLNQEIPILFVSGGHSVSLGDLAGEVVAEMANNKGADKMSYKERFEFNVCTEKDTLDYTGINTELWPMEDRLKDRYYHVTGIAYPDGMRPATEAERGCVPEGAQHLSENGSWWTVGSAAGGKWVVNNPLAVPITPKVTEKEKPPLGLRPKSIWQDERRAEILEAIERYAAERKAIPEEWVKELAAIMAERASE